MKTWKCEITKAEYEKMSEMTYTEKSNYFRDNYCDISIIYGYGYYGVGKPYAENEKYFIDASIGSTCD